jgi:hypothetical protein
MATWGKLEQVEVAHLDGVNSRDVPESLGQALDLVIDDERSQLLDMPPVLICQLSCAWWSRPWQHQPRPCSSSGTRQPPWSWSNKEGNLWDSGSSDGRADSILLLVGVDLPVPSPPGLGRGRTCPHHRTKSLKRSLVEIYLKNYIVTKTESVQH